MLPLRHKKPVRGPGSHPKDDLPFEIEFFEGVVRRDPECADALRILGDAYTKTGRWRNGLKVDKKLARLCPNDPVVFYNLTCSYALLNHVDDAITALKKAVSLGYDDAGWLKKDPDLANLRHDPRFLRIAAELAQNKKRRT